MVIAIIIFSSGGRLLLWELKFGRVLWTFLLLGRVGLLLRWPCAGLY